VRRCGIRTLRHGCYLQQFMFFLGAPVGVLRILSSFGLSLAATNSLQYQQCDSTSGDVSGTCRRTKRGLGDCEGVGFWKVLQILSHVAFEKLPDAPESPPFAPTVFGPALRVVF
jgi:hypothetical protein